MFFINKILPGLTMALGKYLGHGWAQDFSGEVIPREILGEEIEQIGEAVDRLADEYDEAVADELPPSTAYSVLRPEWGGGWDPSLVHVTGTASLIFVWGKVGQLVLHLSPTTHRLRWVAGVKLPDEPFVAAARDYYVGSGPEWARDLIAHLVGELGLPGHLDFEKAAAAATLLRARPEDVFGEELLPSHVAGVRAFALEWATARNEWDVWHLLRAGGLDLPLDELPDDEERSESGLASLAAEAVDNYVHHIRPFREAALASVENNKEWGELLDELPAGVRQYLSYADEEDDETATE